MHTAEDHDEVRMSFTLRHGSYTGCTPVCEPCWRSSDYSLKDSCKSSVNRPFKQLLPGLETGHPVTVSQSSACSFSVSDGREVLFLSPFRAVLGAIHVQVIDRPSPDAPSLTQTNNCANGLFCLIWRFVHAWNFPLKLSRLWPVLMNDYLLWFLLPTTLAHQFTSGCL